MKVVLFTLDASYIHRALSLRTLAPRISERGFDTVQIEYTVKEKRLKVLDRLYRENADIYGFSCYIWNITEMEAAAEKLKLLLPGAKIVFGGPEVSFNDSSYFDTHPYVDYIVSGEGEESLPDLCESVRDGNPPKERIITSKPYEKFTEAGILYSTDKEPDSSVIYYESSRGCPYRCAYCLSANERDIRAKEPDTVLAELLEFEKFENSIKVIKFVDRTFNFNKKRAIRIWEGLLSDKYTKKYHFEICAELVDDDTLSVLSRFPKGKIQLEAGVQSTNPKTLGAINRAGDTALCLDNLRRIKESGNIHIHADLIAGLPYEDLQSFERSFNDVYGTCDMLQLGFLKLLRGSPLFEKAGDYGIICSPTPPYEVLKTDCLSFSDLVVLHSVNDSLERFANSGSFRYTVSEITKLVPSPFGFFRSLGEYIGNVDGISQLSAFEKLFSFCRRLGVIWENELCGRLRLDYYITETGSCPKFLSAPVELPVTPVLRDICIKKAADTHSASACEVHRFTFDRDGFYLIDRKLHRCTRMTEDEIIG